MNEAALSAILKRLGVEPPRLAPDPVAVARLLGLPLSRFAQEGCPLEVRVPWLDVTLWFVPTAADAEALAQEGVSRGRIWTARELTDLLAIPGLAKEDAKTIACTKLEFNGTVVEVRPADPREALPPGA